MRHTHTHTQTKGPGARAGERSLGQAQTDKLKVNWAERRKTNIIPTGGCPITRFNHTSLHKQGTAAHQTPLCTPRVSTSNASACAWQTTRARRPHGGTTAREARQGGVFLREGGQQKRQEATQEGEALGETGAAETGSRRCAHICSGVAIKRGRVQWVESFVVEEGHGADGARGLRRGCLLPGTWPVRDTKVGLSSVAGRAAAWQGLNTHLVFHAVARGPKRLPGAHLALALRSASSQTGWGRVALNRGTGSGCKHPA